MTAETENQTTEQGADLKMNDIKGAINAIDYAAEQGAFKGWTIISQALAIRNRLAAFVAANEPAEEETAASEEPKAASKPKKTSKK